MGQPNCYALCLPLLVAYMWQEIMSYENPRIASLRESRNFAVLLFTFILEKFGGAVVSLSLILHDSRVRSCQ